MIRPVTLAQVTCGQSPSSDKGGVHGGGPKAGSPVHGSVARANHMLREGTYQSNRTVISAKTDCSGPAKRHETGVCGLAKAQAVVQNDDVLLLRKWT